MPTVSVIIPCYNDHIFLPETLASLNKQSYQDFEIIIVDDGSTNPETVEFFNKLQSKYIVYRKPNGGLASARNFGIARSNGSIIFTLDSDDKFSSTFLERAVKIFIERADVGIVSSWVKEFGIRSKTWRTNAKDDFSFFLENRVVACAGFRRTCWEQTGGYDENMQFGYEDWEFWINITSKGWKVHVFPSKMFLYRKKTVSMLKSMSEQNKKDSITYIIEKHKQWYISSLIKGIHENLLINKTTLTIRRSLGIVVEVIKTKVFSK